MDDKRESAELITTWASGGTSAVRKACHDTPFGPHDARWFSGRFEDFIAASRKMRKSAHGSKHEIATSRIEVCAQRGAPSAGASCTSNAT